MNFRPDNSVKDKLKALLKYFSKATEDKNDVQRVWRNMQRSLLHAVNSLGFVSMNVDSGSDETQATDSYSDYISKSMMRFLAEPFSFLDIDKQVDNNAYSPFEEGDAEDQPATYQQTGSIDDMIDKGSIASRNLTHQTRIRNLQSQAPSISLTLDQISSDHLALIVDGESLLKVFGDPEAEEMVTYAISTSQHHPLIYS
jgi:hypothetical protein